jgi:pseudouridine-5'-phosphate glycosidase
MKNGHQLYQRLAGNLEDVLKSRIPDNYIFSKEISRARQLNSPIVALETTVLTHGLPFPKNIELAGNMEDVIQAHGATPATIGVLNGQVVVGMSQEQINKLVDVEKLRKISNRDFGVAIAKKESGGTTVAGTLVVANNAGIRVFATGGIGGVHRDLSIDVSADLPELSRSPVVVVCAGAKAILDLPATLEYLETAGVPVVGYKTDRFPAFYARDSGLSVSVSVDTPEEVAEIAKAHWGMGLRSAVLVAVPPPENVALPMDDVWNAINQSLAEANENGIRGQAVTPFLLARVSELTGNASLTANLGLLLNNARVAAQIAIALSAMGRIKIA